MNLLDKMFGAGKVHRGKVNPDLAVAEGAAVKAAQSCDMIVPSFSHTEVAPRDFGILVISGIVVRPLYNVYTHAALLMSLLHLNAWLCSPNYGLLVCLSSFLIFYTQPICAASELLLALGIPARYCLLAADPEQMLMRLGMIIQIQAWQALLTSSELMQAGMLNIYACVRCVDHQQEPVIHCGTQLPATMTRPFTTVKDFATIIEFEVTCASSS